MPPISFPQSLQNNKLEKQFKKILDAFRQLYINIVFIDGILQISNYTKFLTEMLTKKRKLLEDGNSDIDWRIQCNRKNAPA